MAAKPATWSGLWTPFSMAETEKGEASCASMSRGSRSRNGWMSVAMDTGAVVVLRMALGAGLLVVAGVLMVLYLSQKWQR